MRFPNILVSSSRQWNPGDEFIRFGVKYLFSQVPLRPSNWLLWNRNPDLFVKRWEDAHPKTDFLTNSLREPSLDLVDLVVFAGTPEWTGDAVERIYLELLKYPKVPVLALGVGSGGPGFRLRDYECEVLQRPNAFIRTRSHALASEINAQLGMQKALPLACPAMFCHGDAPPTERRGVAFIVQSSQSINQWIDESLVEEIRNALHDLRGEVELVSFYVDEFMRFSRQFPHLPQVFTEEPLDYLNRLRSYRAVVSTRLHGAIAALGGGTPAVLVSKDNYRLDSTRDLFGRLLPMLPVRQALDWAMSQREADVGEFASLSDDFRQTVREQYLTGLRPFLAQHAPAVLA